jgi:uncharacterized membrane protein HdeD (DUF308 family)
MLTFDQPISRREAVVRGLLAAAVGTVLIVWPGITIGTVIALFAVFAFTDAVVSVARLFSSGRPAGDRVLLGLRALIEVTAGVVAIAYPGATAGVMTVVIGLFAIGAGVNEIAASSKLSKLGVSGTGWLVASGSLSLLTGVALVLWPSIGAVTLAIVFGAYLAASGVLLLISAAVNDRAASFAEGVSR